MGGMLSGVYQVATGASAVFGGSPGRAAADDEYRSRVAASELGALEARQEGAHEAGKVRMLGSELIARQRLAYANSGVDASTGTPASVMADTRLMNEVDARMAENNAARKVRGFKEQKRQAKAEYQRHINEEVQGGVGSILGGIGSLAGGVAGFGK